MDFLTFQILYRNIMDEKKWYALYTFSNMEKKVQGELELLGLEQYLPIQTEIRQWHDRKKKVQIPLFRNYIFCCITNKERELVYRVPQVRCFVSINGKPCVISYHDIEGIKAGLDGGLKISNGQFSSCGAGVIIDSGPFAGFYGTLIRKKGRTRLCVRLQSLQQVILLELEASQLKV